MSRQNDEYRYPAGQVGKGVNAGKRKAGGITSFWPTKEQKEAIRQWDRNPKAVLALLADRMEAGFKITLGYSGEKHSCYAVLREQTPDWTQARAISFFHVETDTCLAMMAYYLEEVNPGWPDNGPSLAPSDELSW